LGKVVVKGLESFGDLGLGQVQEEHSAIVEA